MFKGDHIYVSFFFDGFPVTHHGIDCGDGYVIHYDMQRVSIIPKHQFGKGRAIHVKEYGKCDANDVVIQRAKSKLYEEEYNILFNNCEHFAYYCKTGKHESEQVKKWGAIGSGMVASTLAAAMLGSNATVAIGVATPALLGIGVGLFTYRFAKGNQNEMNALSASNLTFSN